MTTETAFDPDDVRRVANALLENAILHDVERGRNAYNECIFCSAHVYWDEPASQIQHTPDCITRIARDLLS